MLPATARPIAFILTRDRAALLPFYRDVLGLAVTGADDYGTVLDARGLELRLTTVADHVASPHPVLSWSVPDLRATVAALVARGLTFLIYEGFGQDADGIWTSPDGTVKVAWFADPEGNVLGLSEG
ncbi:VOC family protein [Neotabrizicola shimadae]|uniref:VOC domain-containing protein n=1 Tax=Neotabrizicola shimadae TaxID=2807096 RepID=A0A8G1EE87_9RHOB|nr:VOC family protein [Neotabrizicola shimadae]QYZ70978.1 hypothetical protein JO391_05555 [Neotabrizicola shimadae]